MEILILIKAKLNPICLKLNYLQDDRLLLYDTNTQVKKTYRIYPWQ